MRYIIESVEDNKSEIEAVTMDPISYVSNFEPIDVVGGRMVAWSEDGTVYHFDSGDNSLDLDKKFGIVQVGRWNFENGFPKLKKVGNTQESALHNLLIEHLARNRQPSFIKRIFRKSPGETPVDYSVLSLQDLIIMLEKKLEP